MKWSKQLFAVAVIVFLGACESPTIPRFPDAEEEGEDPDPPPTQGSVLSVEGIFFA
jgi:hypothetical protein